MPNKQNFNSLKKSASSKRFVSCSNQVFLTPEKGSVMPNRLLQKLFKEGAFFRFTNNKYALQLHKLSNDTIELNSSNYNTFVAFETSFSDLTKKYSYWCLLVSKPQVGAIYSIETFNELMNLFVMNTKV